MIAAEDEGFLFFRHHLLDDCGKTAAGMCDLRQVASPFEADGQALGLIDIDVSKISDLISERRNPLVETRQPQRRRTHVHPAASRAQIHWAADDCNTTFPHECYGLVR
jgi:hypothetical protein